MAKLCVGTLTQGADEAKIRGPQAHAGEQLRMPCGETFVPNGTERRCAQSGACPVGHEECWLERVTP